MLAPLPRSSLRLSSLLSLALASFLSPRQPPLTAARSSEPRSFNTNNLWVDLVALKKTIDANGGALPLPVIKNGKTVDPTDANSPKVPHFVLPSVPALVSSPLTHRL